jgi:hypothetical protein
MKLNEARDFYYFYSGKTSDIIRQLALAGIALIWLYKVDQGGQAKIPIELQKPVILIISTLILDLLQYVVATGVWGIYLRGKEKTGIGTDCDFSAPSSINYATIFLFWAKVACIILAYILLFQKIYLKIF